ncbi:MAG: hypothetical protein AAGK21_00515 [Bacteroidota bacterium]
MRGLTLLGAAAVLLASPAGAQVEVPFRPPEASASRPCDEVHLVLEGGAWDEGTYRIVCAGYDCAVQRRRAVGDGAHLIRTEIDAVASSVSPAAVILTNAEFGFEDGLWVVTLRGYDAIEYQAIDVRVRLAEDRVIVSPPRTFGRSP